MNTPNHITGTACSTERYRYVVLKHNIMARVKQANKDCPDLSNFPNFSVTGSIKGMKKLYYGKDALLIRKGAYIYNVSSKPYLYHYFAH